MTNEEKILARLDELSAEIQSVKEAVRNGDQSACRTLVMEPLENASKKMIGMNEDAKRQNMEELARMFLISSEHLATALGSLNKMMEFKEDFEPISKNIFQETVKVLDKTGAGFHLENLQEFMEQGMLNMSNIAESLKMLGSAMEFKRDAGKLTKMAFDDLVERLEALKNKGVFDALSEVFGVVERMGERLSEIDFNNVEPVRGVFGMLKALKRQDVQEGLGIMIELSSLASAVKKPA